MSSLALWLTGFVTIAAGLAAIAVWPISRALRPPVGTDLGGWYLLMPIGCFAVVLGANALMWGVLIPVILRSGIRARIGIITATFVALAILSPGAVFILSIALTVVIPEAGPYS